ncbi:MULTISPECIES: helix-turn-helix transcriptional regulator [Thiorhodovibrio]|nr:MULTISPECIES: hypothetical protein [Thiorhodovibrio]WPL12834.1 addiction module antidote protein, HigA family [Thiorhodovibrio litoralis]
MDKIQDIHPGEVLREEFLLPLAISEERIAAQIDLPLQQIRDIGAGS